MSYPNLTSDEIDDITVFFNAIDTDHDGFITFDEIKAACAVDINADGVITDDEITQCSHVWINDILPLEDLNSDSKLTLVELLTFNDSYKGKAI